MEKTYLSLTLIFIALAYSVGEAEAIYHPVWWTPNQFSIIREINMAKMTWQAGKNDIWDELNIKDPRDFSKLMGTKLDPEANMNIPSVTTLLGSGQIPESFDARETFKGYVHPIRNQLRYCQFEFEHVAPPFFDVLTKEKVYILCIYINFSMYCCTHLSIYLLDAGLAGLLPPQNLFQIVSLLHRRVK